MTVQHHYHCQPENSPPRRFQMFIGRCVFYYPNCIVHFGHIGTLWKKSCLFGFTSGVNVGHFFFLTKLCLRASCLSEMRSTHRKND